MKFTEAMHWPTSGFPRARAGKEAMPNRFALGKLVFAAREGQGLDAGPDAIFRHKRDLRQQSAPTGRGGKAPILCPSL